MKDKKILFRILIVFSFFALAFFLAEKKFQNDTFYTIKIGESILKNGIDMKEHFSWIPNLSYTYPHVLFDILIYSLYNLGGFNYIYYFTIVFGFVVLFSMYYLCKKIINNEYLAYLVTLFMSFGLGGFFAARAQLFSYFFLLIILYSIEKLRETENKKYYILIFISSLIIANSHLAVWPLIFVLFLPFVVQDIIYLLAKKFNWKFVNSYHIEIEESKLKITLIGILVVLITGFMTPNFLVPFTYFINTRKGISMNYISEHLPLRISDRPYLYIGLLVFIILILNKKVKIKLRDLFLISGLFLLSFLSNRNCSLFFILAVFSFARMFTSLKLDSLMDAVKSSAFSIALLIFFSVFLITTVKFRIKEDFVDVREYPTAASDYIIENLDYKNIKLFNEYNYGSYLMYREIPVFIDSRADLYLQEFNPGCIVYKDFLIIFDDYNNIFNKYGVTHIILKNTSNLSRLLNLDDNYNRLYLDDYFSIYEKLN